LETQNVLQSAGMMRDTVKWCAVCSLMSGVAMLLGTQTNNKDKDLLLSLSE
jgi:hypothetical protein